MARSGIDRGNERRFDGRLGIPDAFLRANRPEMRPVAESSAAEPALQPQLFAEPARHG